MVAGFLQRVLLARVVEPGRVRRLLGGEQRHLHREQHHGAGNHPVGVQVHGRGRRARRRRTARGPQDAGRCWACSSRSCCVLAAPLLARFVKAPEHVSLFRLVAAIPLVYAFYAVYVGTANGLRKFHVQAGFDVGFSTAKTILLLAGAVVGRMLGHSVAGAFVGFIAAALIILLVAGRTIGMRPGEQTFSGLEPRRLHGRRGASTPCSSIWRSTTTCCCSAVSPARSRPGRPADALAGAYEAVRNLALLPYQALLVVTFVIFPLVSRATFAEDRDATAAYVRQTLRYALILGAALAVVLSARPAALLAILYPQGLRRGRAGPAHPGRRHRRAGAALHRRLDRHRVGPARHRHRAGRAHPGGRQRGSPSPSFPAPRPARPCCAAAATATALGMLAGLLAALVYLWRRFAALPPLAVGAARGRSRRRWPSAWPPDARQPARSPAWPPCAASGIVFAAVAAPAARIRRHRPREIREDPQVEEERARGRDEGDTERSTLRHESNPETKFVGVQAARLDPGRHVGRHRHRLDRRAS